MYRYCRCELLVLVTNVVRVMGCFETFHARLLRHLTPSRWISQLRTTKYKITFLGLNLDLKTALPKSHFVHASYLLTVSLYFNNETKLYWNNTSFLSIVSLNYASHTLNINQIKWLNRVYLRTPRLKTRERSRLRTCAMKPYLPLFPFAVLP
jgi:hypothetical protein